MDKKTPKTNPNSPHFKTKFKTKEFSNLKNLDKIIARTNIFRSHTFMAKLFLKLASNVIDPMIICVLTFKFEPPNRKLEEIEHAITWLKNCKNFYELICLKETKESSHDLLLAIGWVLFYKYYSCNTIIKKLNYKIDYFFVIFTGDVEKLSIKFTQQKMSVENYLIYLFKLYYMKEKDILNQCNELNKNILDIDLNNIKNFFNENIEFNFRDLKEKARTELINLGFNLENFKHIEKFKVSSIENYSKIFQCENNIKNDLYKCKKRISLWIGEYERVSTLSEGMFFGYEVNEIIKDNFIYIAKKNCDIGYINKNYFNEIYPLLHTKMQNIFKDIKNKFYVLDEINDSKFYYEYLKYFSYKKFHKGDKIFIQGAPFDGVYFIQKGEINLSTKISIENLPNLLLNISSALYRFTEHIPLKNKKIEYKKLIDEDLKIDGILKNPLKSIIEYNKLFKILTRFDIKIFNNFEILNLFEIYDYHNDLSNFTAECISDEAYLFFISKNSLLTLLAKEKCAYNSVMKLVEMRTMYYIGKLKSFQKLYQTQIDKKFSFPNKKPFSLTHFKQNKSTLLKKISSKFPEKRNLNPYLPMFASAQKFLNLKNDIIPHSLSEQRMIKNKSNDFFNTKINFHSNNKLINKNSNINKKNIFNSFEYKPKKFKIVIEDKLLNINKIKKKIKTRSFDINNNIEKICETKKQIIKIDNKINNKCFSTINKKNISKHIFLEYNNQKNTIKDFFKGSKDNFATKTFYFK